MGTDILSSHLASVGEGHVDKVLCKDGTLSFTFPQSLGRSGQSQICRCLKTQVKAASFLLKVVAVLQLKVLTCSDGKFLPS